MRCDLVFLCMIFIFFGQLFKMLAGKFFPGLLRIHHDKRSQKQIYPESYPEQPEKSLFVTVQSCRFLLRTCEFVTVIAFSVES